MFLALLLFGVTCLVRRSLHVLNGRVRSTIQDRALLLHVRRDTTSAIALVRVRAVPILPLILAWVPALLLWLRLRALELSVHSVNVISIGRLGLFHITPLFVNLWGFLHRKASL